MGTHGKNRNVLIRTGMRLPIKTWEKLKVLIESSDCSISDMLRGMIATTINSPFESSLDRLLSLYEERKKAVAELYQKPFCTDLRNSKESLSDSLETRSQNKGFHLLDFFILEEDHRALNAACAQLGINPLELRTAIVEDCVIKLEKNPELLDQYYSYFKQG